MAGFNRPKPVAFSAAQLSDLVAEAQTQKVGGSYQKSTDPNFPYWAWEGAKQYLVYVPRILAVDEEGNPILDIDKPLIHDINSNGSYGKVRCTKNLVMNGPDGKPLEDGNGVALFDGSCPVCEGVGTAFDLANAGIEHEASMQGLNPDDRENEAVKRLRSSHFSARPLKQPDRKMTIPLVVFDTVDNDQGKPAITKDSATGKPNFNVFWYTISERQFEKTWQNAIDTAEEPLETIAGAVFYVQFGKKDANNNAPSPRDAAKDLTVNLRATMTSRLNDEGILTEIDEAVKAKGWSKAKAAEVLSDNQFISVPDINNSIAGILADMNTKMQLFKTPQGSATQIASNGGGVSLDALRGNNGGANAQNGAPAGALPAGATDADEVVNTGGGLLS